MKVYILEDEINILKYILSLVEAIPFLQVVGYSAEIAVAAEEIPPLAPDLILADIQLKDGNSFTLLNELQIDAQLIFITAYEQYAIDALNIGALAYLLKPLDALAFRKAVENCYQKSQTHRFHAQQAALAMQHYTDRAVPKRIALRSAEFTQVVHIDDILYCQSDKGYTTFFLNDNSQIIVSKVLKEYENFLRPPVFVRCHQSYLININHLKKYFRYGQVEMTNGTFIPVSERKRQLLLEMIEGL